jgi:hypothetical protein
VEHKADCDHLTSTLPRNKTKKAVFISYRRSDSSDVTGRIFDALSSKFSKDVLFKDVESIPLGADFRTVISNAVGQCKVLLAVIGPDWLEVKDPNGGRRLDNPDDYVRLEIASALKREIPVIPVLVEQAVMPRKEHLPLELQDLSYRNGIPVRHDPDFHHDMDRLCEELNLHVQPTKTSFFRRFALPLIVAFSLLAIVAAVVISRNFPPGRATEDSAGDTNVESYQIHLYREDGGTSVFVGDIGERGPTPQIGDNVSIEIKFKHPAYAFLIAFNTDGTVQLCHPDQESTVPHRVSHLSFPETSAKGFYFTEGAGQQAFGLVVSTEKLPSFADWKASQQEDIPWKNFGGTAYVKLEAPEHPGGSSAELPRGQVKQRAGAEVEALDHFLREKLKFKSVVTVGFPIQKGQVSPP